MNILFLSSVYPNSKATVRGTFNRDLCNAMSARDHMRIVAPVPWREVIATSSVSKRTEQGASIVPVTRPTFFYPPKVLRHRYGQFMWQSIRRDVARHSAVASPDWVLSYWAHPDGEAGLRAARAVGAKSAVIVGGSDVLILTRNRRRCQAVSQVLRETDLVITVCEGLRERVIELGVRPEQAHTVYQGVDPEIFSHGSRQESRRRLDLPKDTPEIIWVGRMVGIKRLDILIEAFARVHESNQRARLHLLGDGESSNSVREDVAARGLSDSVVLHGPVNRDELCHWYRAADATVLSSDSEGLPNVLRESLACETPWVSTDVGSVGEIATSEYSIMVPPGDSEKLCDGMLRILDSGFQDGAAGYVARTWNDTADQIRQIMSLQPDESDYRPSTAADSAIATSVQLP